MAGLGARRTSCENAVPITALAGGATTVTIIGVGWVTQLVVPVPRRSWPTGR